MLKMNEYITVYTPKDYSGHLPQGGIDLDCTLGVNPSPLPKLVLQSLQGINEINQSKIKHYPHDETLREKLALYYKRQGINGIDAENLILGDGSIDLLYNINLLFLGGGKKALGYAPQFTAYTDHVNCIGALYNAYILKRENNYRFEADEYIKKMNTEYALYIIENPNNPTGQVLNLNDVRKIAAKALALDTVLIVDEAYGDYMEIADSALNLINEFPNIIVTRSFSKGMGMAGMRLGYAAVSVQSGILPQIKKTLCPFNCNAIARLLACAMLDSIMDEGGISLIINTNEISECKNKTLASLTKLKAAHTSPRTPIFTLYYPVEDAPGQPPFDLQRFLAEKVRLAAVGCGTYDGLDARAVRIMLPDAKTTNSKLLPMLTLAESLLE
ncbi:MAG: aminotransferase class I/II-fold pyridoxal phosphate-dependent enzyme [Spirochaetaceae bacterium]|jgi:histidinol-phosphate aminotransferase|nr:aminotransferase class I/II-fold pyridoxal phosphate-dependent enzyme [Spirochaetaceae bacterium]